MIVLPLNPSLINFHNNSFDSLLKEAVGSSNNKISGLWKYIRKNQIICLCPPLSLDPFLPTSESIPFSNLLNFVSS